MASNSAFDGATLLAAKELKTKTVIAAIFRIFIDQPLEPFCPTPDKHKIYSPGGRFGGHYNQQKTRPQLLLYDYKKNITGTSSWAPFFPGELRIQICRNA